MLRNNRKAQVAIFVIIALILVVAVALVFTLVKGPGIIQGSAVNDPQGFIERCARDSAQEAIEKLSPQGSYLIPEEPTLRYDEHDVGFLCYTAENEELCINKRPMLANHIENEIKTYIEPIIENCFDTLRNDLAKYDYKEEGGGLDVTIRIKQVLIQVNKEISFTKAGQNIVINNFNGLVNNPMWDFVRITQDIINDEVSCDCDRGTCDADTRMLRIYNPKFDVDKFVTGENEEIYIIKEDISENQFVFAIRNCVRLPE